MGADKRKENSCSWHMAASSAGSWQRGNPPPGLSGALALNAYSYIYKLSCVISRVSRSRLEIPQAGPHYYRYIDGWHIAIYLFKISEMHAEMAI